jgi:hypothetical protein
MILWKTIKDHDTLFILAEVSHFLGIFVLGYKLQQKRSVSGWFVLAAGHGSDICMGLKVSQGSPCVYCWKADNCNFNGTHRPVIGKPDSYCRVPDGATRVQVRAW